MDLDQFQSKPTVMGGKLCFRGTRLPVETVVEVILAGWSDETILAQFTTLTPGALRAARRLAADPEGGWEESQVA